MTGPSKTHKTAIKHWLMTAMRAITSLVVSVLDGALRPLKDPNDNEKNSKIRYGPIYHWCEEDEACYLKNVPSHATRLVTPCRTIRRACPRVKRSQINLLAPSIRYRLAILLKNSHYSPIVKKRQTTFFGK